MLLLDVRAANVSEERRIGEGSMCAPSALHGTLHATEYDGLALLSAPSIARLALHARWDKIEGRQGSMATCMP